MNASLFILAGLAFFVIFFSLSMLTMCYSAEEGSAKRKFYDTLFAGKRFDYFLRRFNARQSVSYMCFVFGIVGASFYVLRQLTTQATVIRTSYFRSVTVQPVRLSMLYKAFLTSFYVAQDGLFLILLFKGNRSRVECATDLVLHKLPHRMHYCKICGANTQKFDHHCAWVGRCVGAGNAFWFTAFLAGTFYANFGHFVVNLQMYQNFAGLSISQLFFNFTPYCAQTALFLVVAVFIAPFTLAHISNLLRNQTTFEKLRRKWLADKIRADKFFISADYVGTTEKRAGADYLSKEQSITAVLTRNVWDKGPLRNLAEAIRMALH